VSRATRTATIVPHSVNIECANCRTPIYESVIAADNNIPWGRVVNCENCGHPVRVPPSPFAGLSFGAPSLRGK
jgi:hypothetical protein